MSSVSEPGMNLLDVLVDEQEDLLSTDLSTRVDSAEELLKEAYGLGSKFAFNVVIEIIDGRFQDREGLISKDMHDLKQMIRHAQKTLENNS